MGEMADEAYERAMDELEHMDQWEREDFESEFYRRQPQGFPKIKPRDDDWFKDKQKRK